MKAAKLSLQLVKEAPLLLQPERPTGQLNYCWMSSQTAPDTGCPPYLSLYHVCYRRWQVPTSPAAQI